MKLEKLLRMLTGEWVERIADRCEALERLGFDAGIRLDPEGPTLVVEKRKSENNGKNR